LQNLKLKPNDDSESHSADSQTVCNSQTAKKIINKELIVEPSSVFDTLLKTPFSKNGGDCWTILELF